jgi:tetratricopeptide (TPR) repeat protein
LRLTDQGRTLLERGKTDDAISLLERAVSLHPTNGENYYYLAEAWLMKGNPAQAAEFNRLAGTYLKEDPLWMEKVLTQRKRIEALGQRV